MKIGSIKLNKYHLLTLTTFGLFLGFWLGYFVFAQVRIKVICMPSGKILIDRTRNLMHEVRLDIDVSECKYISLMIKKPTIPELIFGSKSEEGKFETLANETVETPELVGGGIPSPPKKYFWIPEKEEPKNSTRTWKVEVFGLCSADIPANSSFFYTSTSCIIKDILPYYIILEKNETHVKTSFYENIGFNKTYNLTNPTAIFRVFIRALEIEGKMERIEAYGALSDYFSLKDFKTEENWITALLLMNREISFKDWSSLRIYLKTTEKTYYLGDIWFYLVVK